MGKFRLAVLVTSFNRKEITVNNLIALSSMLDRAAIYYKIFLVDDNSSDGTAELVKERVPNSTVHVTAGEYYWNKGMCLAFDYAREEPNWDAYLLFNDDVTVTLYAALEAIHYFIQLDKLYFPILVGATYDLTSPEVTYSGFNLESRIIPLRVKRVFPSSNVVPVDMPNGNFLLVDAGFFEDVGGLDRNYKHAYGDSDLGLVAKRMGRPALLFNIPVGRCAPNVRSKSKSGFRKRWKSLSHPKTALSDYVHYCYKHFPRPLLPVYVVVFCTRALFL
jgi:GT2 family glycosyltransferase